MWCDGKSRSSVTRRPAWSGSDASSYCTRRWIGWRRGRKGSGEVVREEVVPQRVEVRQVGKEKGGVEAVACPRPVAPAYLMARTGVKEEEHFAAAEAAVW